jgi:hypothetical protein
MTFGLPGIAMAASRCDAAISSRRLKNNNVI